MTKRFVDKNGLERFKDDLEAKLTHEAPKIPTGKRLVNVAQKDGVVQAVFDVDDTAKQADLDAIKDKLAGAGLSHNAEESTYTDDNGQSIDLPERTIMLKGFTNKPVVEHQTQLRTGKFFIINTEN